MSHFHIPTDRFPNAIVHIDDGDDEFFINAPSKWYPAQRGREHDIYVGRMARRASGGRYIIALHRELLGVTDPKIIVDHRNGDTFDCRRSNLRIATHQQNMANRANSKFRSLPKGVKRYGGGFRASIQDHGQIIHLGCFYCPIEAAKAYDKAAIDIFGEFARTNQQQGVY